MINVKGGMAVSLRVSAGPYDCRQIAIVPVIASFDPSGRIIPLYVRIKGIPYKIDSCRANRKLGGIEEFYCKIRDGEYWKPLLLTYYKEEGAWTVPGYAVK